MNLYLKPKTQRERSKHYFSVKKKRITDKLILENADYAVFEIPETTYTNFMLKNQLSLEQLKIFLIHFNLTIHHFKQENDFEVDEFKGCKPESYTKLLTYA